MNQFESLCKLASEENWCWKLSCTTCGHMHFRYAFAELAAGKSPADTNWIIHGRRTRYSNTLGSLPRRYSEEQKASVSQICNQADIRFVARNCKFPDWLGYLGLVLEHMYSNSQSYNELSRSWALQLSEMVTFDSVLRATLALVAEGNSLLSIQDLEACESSMMRRSFHT